MSTLSETPIEGPRINEAYAMRPYRYLYAWHPTRDDNLPNSVAKVDTTTGKAKVWIDNAAAEANTYMGEPVFLPAPGASAEDDGVVLSVGVDVTKRAAFLVVLNATTMTELARAWAGAHVTFGFHTLFVPSA